MKYNFGISN